MPLADVARVIACLAEHAGVGLTPGRLEGLKVPVPVPRHPLAGKQRGPAHTADGGGDAVVGEPDTILRQGIQMRRLHNGVPGAAQRVMPPVIGKQDQDIQRLGRGRDGRKGNEEAKGTKHGERQTGAEAEAFRGLGVVHNVTLQMLL